MERLIGRYFASYRLKSILGFGGMGTVFLAHEEELDRMVAVKVLSPALAQDSVFIERFNREARFLASIAHPNLIHVYSIGRTDDGYYYMAMEYLEGASLDQQIREHSHLSLDESFTIIGHVLSALWAIHRAGLVHRDVKPSNIMLCNDKRVVLMDFGLAKAPDMPGLTREGIIAGTPEYMSPEQALGEELDNRSDLYSLGVTLFEMLTGAVPFNGPSAITILRKHCEEPIPNVRLLNPALPAQSTDLINRALAKERNRRFSDASELASAMLSIHPTSEIAALARRSGKSELPSTRILETDPSLKIKPPRRSLRPKPMAFLLSAMVLIVLAVSGYFIVEGFPGISPSPSATSQSTSIKLLPAEYQEFEGRKFIGNPICQIKIDGSAPEFGRIIEITEDGKFTYNPLGTELEREIDLNSSTVEIVIPTREELKKLNIEVE